MITNAQSQTRIDEIADSIYRISTPVPANPALPAGFTFNQFLIVDDEPVLFHTGMHKLFPLVSEAVAAVMPAVRLRWLAYSHYEADECGSLPDWLRIAPNARPLTGELGALVNASDFDAEPRGLADGEVLSIGKKRVRWHATPHVPHGWDAGIISELTTRTLFCGDLFTQAGDVHAPVTESEILSPSEMMRGAMDYYANPATARDTITRLAQTEPVLLATMHGASYRGDGAALLRGLAATMRTVA